MFGDYGHIKRPSLNIPDHYTTNPQAEVLLLDGAPIDNITGVYFQRSATHQQCSAQFPDLPCHLKGGYFEGRNDYVHWK